MNDDKKPKDARKAFERAAKLRPDFTAARVGVAYSLLLSNKLKDARKAATGLLNANPNSVEARYMLGLINLRLGSPSRALDEVSEALKINPDYAPTLYVKSLALLHLYAEPFTGPMTEFHKTRRPYLSLAAETLEKLLAVAPKSPDAPFWREQLETVRVHARIGDEDNASRTFFTARDVDTKAILLYRPEPGFTTEARKNGVTGVVRLRLVLAADGTIKHILVLQSLPDGLTEAAIAAARSIKFTPATKNGQPVSQVVTVEYNFNIY